MSNPRWEARQAEEARIRAYNNAVSARAHANIARAMSNTQARQNVLNADAALHQATMNAANAANNARNS